MTVAAQGEGATPAIVTDHAFQPRRSPVILGPYGTAAQAARLFFRANPYLCKVCRLAEAAHDRTEAP